MTHNNDTRYGSDRHGIDDIYVVDADDPLHSSPAYFAMLDTFDPIEPDSSVWQRIEADIAADSRQPTAPSLSSVDGSQATAKPGRGWPMRMMLAAAAVFVLVAGALFMISGGGSAEIVAVRDLVDPATGATVMTVEVADDGTGTAANVALPALEDSATYQLWSVVGDEIVSVGLLGPDPSGVPLRIEGDPAVLALTVEQSGGVAVSTQDPVAVWTLSS